MATTNITKEEAIKAIMTDDETGEVLVTFASQVADQLVRDNLGKTQIRNTFSEIRQIQTMWNQPTLRKDALRRLNMLKPKLAYQTDREPTNKYFRDIVTSCIDYVNQAGKVNEESMNQAFKRFVDFCEAILAYHRAAGVRR